jgi:beta-glucosidase
MLNLKMWLAAVVAAAVLALTNGQAILGSEHDSNGVHGLRGHQQPSFLWKNKGLSSTDRAAELIAAMTLEEKLVMLHGSPNDSNGDVIYVGWVPGNKRLGIPELRLNDGPQGYRDDLNPWTTTAWPSALTVSVSWDAELFQAWGAAMGKEFYGKGANVQLGPGVNLARVPRNGRNFEYISGEDPYLGYTLVQPLVKGIQSQKVVANAKHWVENNQETDRSAVSEIVDERTRHELYYQPFYGAVDAGVGSFMCSYNKVNGLWACENPETLNVDLKGHLGFKGWVMSDWWATHSTSINEGLDQEMPTAYFFTPENLQAMLANSTLVTDKIDESLTRIFVPMFEIGLFDDVNSNPSTSDVTSDDHNELARRISADTHVLLKNDHAILPLPTAAANGKPYRIAVIGHHARSPIIGGGGSGSVMAKHVITPYAGILSALGIDDAYPVKTDCTSVPLIRNASINQGCWPSVPAVSMEACAGFCAADASCRFYSYNSGWPWCTMYPTKNRMYSDASTGTTSIGQCLKAEPAPVWQCNGDNICVATADGSDIDVAAQLAKDADAVVAVVASYAAEGGDRPSLSFDAQLDGSCQLSAPGQDSLIRVLTATGARVIVAVAAPGAMLAPWKDDVKAILHGFMPGQEYGHALADVLFGKVNPSSKLSLTMPNMENEVGFSPDAYPGTQLEGNYTEKMLIGYRWYNAYSIKPAFSFGHGLSFTTFGYGHANISLSPNTREVTVSCEIINSGKVPGREIAQLYVTFPESAQTPKVQLKGFVKTKLLAPTDSETVKFVIKARDLRVWDAGVHAWKDVVGQFEYFVGASSVDARLHGKFKI